MSERLTNNDFVDLNSFRNNMIYKLSSKRNKFKDHWSKESISDLFDGLLAEVEELREELENEDFDIDNAKFECIDIANFSFFIWCKFK